MSDEKERTERAAAPIDLGYQHTDECKGMYMCECPQPAAPSPDEALQTAIREGVDEYIEGNGLVPKGPLLTETLIPRLKVVLDRAVREAKHKAHDVSDYDWSRGDIISAEQDGTIVLDDGITTWNPVRASKFLLREAEKRHADELVAVREECARISERMYDRHVAVKKIRSLSPSGALEAIENRARLEAAKFALQHGRNSLKIQQYINELEAKRATKEQSAE